MHIARRFLSISKVRRTADKQLRRESCIVTVEIASFRGCGAGFTSALEVLMTRSCCAVQANYFKSDADTAVSEGDAAFAARVASAPVPSNRCCIDARAYTQYVCACPCLWVCLLSENMVRQVVLLQPPVSSCMGSAGCLRTPSQAALLRSCRVMACNYQRSWTSAWGVAAPVHYHLACAVIASMESGRVDRRNVHACRAAHAMGI